jgi:hypothetical protein
MGKRKSKSGAAPGDAGAPRARKVAWWIYAVVGIVVVGWLAVMVRWIVGAFA